jgi:hypothetical protein
LHGAQVVGGSNPPVPTKFLEKEIFMQSKFDQEISDFFSKIDFYSKNDFSLKNKKSIFYKLQQRIDKLSADDKREFLLSMWNKVYFYSFEKIYLDVITWQLYVPLPKNFVVLPDKNFYSAVAIGPEQVDLQQQNKKIDAVISAQKAYEKSYLDFKNKFIELLKQNDFNGDEIKILEESFEKQKDHLSSLKKLAVKNNDFAADEKRVDWHANRMQEDNAKILLWQQSKLQPLAASRALNVANLLAEIFVTNDIDSVSKRILNSDINVNPSRERIGAIGMLLKEAELISSGFYDKGKPELLINVNQIAAAKKNKDSARDRAIAAAKAIISHPSFDLLKTDDANNCTALHYAVRFGYPEIVDAILVKAESKSIDNSKSLIYSMLMMEDGTSKRYTPISFLDSSDMDVNVRNKIEQVFLKHGINLQELRQKNQSEGKKHQLNNKISITQASQEAQEDLDRVFYRFNHDQTFDIVKAEDYLKKGATFGRLGAPLQINLIFQLCAKHGLDKCPNLIKALIEENRNTKMYPKPLINSDDIGSVIKAAKAFAPGQKVLLENEEQRLKKIEATQHEGQGPSAPGASSSDSSGSDSTKAPTVGFHFEIVDEDEDTETEIVE